MTPRQIYTQTAWSGTGRCTMQHAVRHIYRCTCATTRTSDSSACPDGHHTNKVYPSVIARKAPRQRLASNPHGDLECRLNVLRADLFRLPTTSMAPPPMYCVGFTHTCPYTRHSTLPTATTLGSPYIYHRQLRLPRTLRHQGLIPFPPREEIAPSAEGFIHANCGFEKRRVFSAGIGWMSG